MKHEDCICLMWCLAALVFVLVFGFGGWYLTGCN